MLLDVLVAAGGDVGEGLGPLRELEDGAVGVLVGLCDQRLDVDVLPLRSVQRGVPLRQGRDALRALLLDREERVELGTHLLELVNGTLPLRRRGLLRRSALRRQIG